VLNGKVLRNVIPKIVEQIQKKVDFCQFAWFCELYGTLYAFLAHVDTTRINLMTNEKGIVSKPWSSFSAKCHGKSHDISGI